MPIAIEPSITSRVRAYAEAHPEATPKEIATALKLLTSDVVRALQREPAAKVKAKPVQVTFPTGATGERQTKLGDSGYVSVEDSAMSFLQNEARLRRERGKPPTALDLKIAQVGKLWSDAS